MSIKDLRGFFLAAQISVFEDLTNGIEALVVSNQVLVDKHQNMLQGQASDQSCFQGIEHSFVSQGTCKSKSLTWSME